MLDFQFGTLDGMTRCVAHPGNSPDTNGLVASFLERDGVSPGKYRPSIPVVGHDSRYRGEREILAVDLLIWDRGQGRRAGPQQYISY